MEFAQITAPSTTTPNTGSENSTTTPPVSTTPPVEPLTLPNLPPPEKKEKEIKLDINPKEKEVNNETVVNFKTQSFLKDYVQTETIGQKQQQADPTGQTKFGFPQGETVEQIRARMAKEEEDESKKYTVEDFEEIADFLMDLFDMGAVFFIRWYSKDNTDAPYNIPTDKMKRLKMRLAKLLMRMQAKFPLGLLFALSLIMAYATPMRKAHEHRKQVDEATRKKARATQRTEETKATVVSSTPPPQRNATSTQTTQQTTQQTITPTVETQEVPKQEMKKVIVQDPETGEFVTKMVPKTGGSGPKRPRGGVSK